MKLQEMTYFDFISLDLALFIPSGERTIEQYDGNDLDPGVIIEFGNDDKFPNISRKFPGRITVCTREHEGKVYWIAAISHGPVIDGRLQVMVLGTGPVEM